MLSSDKIIGCFVTVDGRTMKLEDYRTIQRNEHKVEIKQENRMNAKKCKQLRRLAREQAPKRSLPSPEGQPQQTADAPYREYQIAPGQRFITLSPTCVRGLYQHYKKLYRKHQQMPVLAVEVAATNAATDVA